MFLPSDTIVIFGPLSFWFLDVVSLLSYVHDIVSLDELLSSGLFPSIVLLLLSSFDNLTTALLFELGSIKKLYVLTPALVDDIV